MDFYTYILASKPRGTLYIGVTHNIGQRVYQHKTKMIKGFTSQYRVHMLVYYETWGTAREAIAREKQLKHWNRAWKIQLIEEMNPLWTDYCADLTQISPYHE